MKIYTNRWGQEIGQTMTVKELREKLAEYPDDMPVFGGYEGVKGCINPGSFEVAEYTRCRVQDEQPCLMIDVEDY
jgi:hypothetical protein